ncbi:ZIP zinc/iron transport family [Atractiella rhizophila]|nr:ZIP zinc/iron transport family [Atractiella rhizophila]
MADIEVEEINCGSGNDYDGRLGLRIGGIFIIFITSFAGTAFPIAARRFPSLKVPTIAYDTAKYFGSGVIIATAFIHLLTPAFEELGSECLSGAWTTYPWAAALSMAAVFAIFLVELFAFRLGSDFFNGSSQPYDPHSHSFAAHGPEVGGGHLDGAAKTDKADSDYALSKGSIEGKEFLETASTPSAQILGVAILEFGVIFHSVVIGLTLGVTNEFTTLFIVIIFHQTFEALGLGARLAMLPLPRSSLIPWLGGIAYSLATPLSLAIGLGVRTSYNPESTTASIVSGVLDALSSGILLYTGLVELLAHEFIFSDTMRKAPTWKVLFAVGNILLGAGLMALLGYWA